LPFKGVRKNMVEPTAEMRNKRLEEYTKQKETLEQTSIFWRSIDTVLRQRNPEFWRSIIYKVVIYDDEEPKTIQFQARDDVDAMVQTVNFLEKLDGFGYELKRKKLFWTFVKDAYPVKGLIYVHHYDGKLLVHTRESKAIQKIKGEKTW
jgi:hypothetical protein